MNIPWGLISKAFSIGAEIDPEFAPELLAASALANNAPQIISDVEVVIGDVHPAITAFKAALADVDAHVAATAPEKAVALSVAAQAVVDAHPPNTRQAGRSGTETIPE